MSLKTREIIILVSGFFLFLTDQTLKFLAREVFITNHTILNFLGWHPFQNSGVAFSLPLPNYLTILFTIPILLIVITLLFHFFNNKKTVNIFLGITLIFFGATSNLFDRLLFKTTTDYLIIGAAVINLADILIVTGFLYYLIPNNFFKH